MKKINRGYTFVEILVVITIIALIAGISAVSYVATNKNARDARRMSDIETIRSALELFRSETGFYPDLSVDANNCISSTEIVDTSISPSVNYIKIIPKDPKDPDKCYTYTRTTETTYSMTYYSEKDSEVKTVTNP